MLPASAPAPAPRVLPLWLLDVAQTHLAYASTDPDGFQTRLRGLEKALGALCADMDALGDTGAPEGRRELAAGLQSIVTARARLHTASRHLAGG